MSDVLKLAVGMPVYNGQNYLAEALTAVLNQSFSDFELIISDNASTDTTEEIVIDLTKDDTRVVYLRQPVNLGAAPNYNAAFESAQPSDYFVWVAHDDVPHERFFEACVEALDGDPAAALAFTRARRIGPAGEEIEQLPGRPRLTLTSAADRFGDAIKQSYNPHPIFGVMRRSALLGTHLHGSYLGSDRTLLAEMGLQGRFVEIPETLFDIRWHQEKSTQQPYAKDKRNTRDVWFDSSNEGKIRLPRWIRFGAYIRALLTAPVSPREKVRGFGKLARWLGVWKNSKALIYEIVAAVQQLIARILKGIR